MSKPDRTAPERPPRAPEEREDEIIHVPKGKNPLRYRLTVALLVLLLVIFVISGLFGNVASTWLRSLFGQEEQGLPVYVSWTHPRLGARELNYQDFVLERRRFDDFFRVASPGLDTRAMLEDDELARLIVTDEVAREAGIDVSKRELAKAILEGDVLFFGGTLVQLQPFGDKANFVNQLDGYGMTAADFQDTLQRVLRIARYEGLVSAVLMRPLPADIEASWKEQHQERAFDVVAVEVAAAAADAEAQLPDEAGLQTWFDGQRPNVKRRIAGDKWRQERASAELCLYRFDRAGDVSALLAKYPRAEGTDLAKLARDYYDLFAYARFKKPEVLPAPPPDAPVEQPFMPFADVEGQASVEAQVKAAMEDFLRSLRDRTAAGETVDLALEAAALGLEYLRVDEPKTQAEWRELEGIGAPGLAGAITVAARGDKIVNVTVPEKSLACGRVLAREAEGPPPLGEVHDLVVAEWKKEKAVELARAKLQGLRDALPPKEPAPAEAPAPTLVVEEAAFAAKVTELGFELVAVDWFDPQRAAAALPAEPTLADRFHQELKKGGQIMLRLAEGEVSTVYVDAESQRAWLARSRGSRDPAAVEIGPEEVEALQQRAGYEAFDRLRNKVFGLEAYRAKYGLTFARDTAAEGDGEGDGEKSDAGG